ncbi:Peptide chain release factor [Nymphaea thermarum]|nr:Peptide chain release factor [Nymphaea thermarum]
MDMNFVGLFSLRKKIEDIVVRAETIAPTALELEQVRQIKQEEMVRRYNLWDDPDKSSEILLALGDSNDAVCFLKELKYQAEEVKLVTQLAEMDAINYWLFKQAYNTSMDISNQLSHYEMTKLLTGPYDKEGACIMIQSAPGSKESEIWAEKLLHMYLLWSKKRGFPGRITEKYTAKSGIRFVTVEFEWQFAYGYLSGERGVHRLIKGFNRDSIPCQIGIACVDVIPLFLASTPDIPVEDKDIEVSTLLSCGEKEHLVYRMERAASILHVPTGIRVQCSGERSHFANKIKALKRLKAKLLVLADQQEVSDITKISRDGIFDLWQEETRRYMFHPHKLVHDVKTNTQLPDLVSVLDGGLEPLVQALVRQRHTRDS